MFEEEIRKILDDEPIKMYPSIEDARRAIRKRHKELAHQICQLEPKPEYDASITQLPDPFEPKADEGRLLTEEEITKITPDFPVYLPSRQSDTRQLLIAQRAKDLKFEQARVERILDIITEDFVEIVVFLMSIDNCKRTYELWHQVKEQALKK